MRNKGGEIKRVLENIATEIRDEKELRTKKKAFLLISLVLPFSSTSKVSEKTKSHLCRVKFVKRHTFIKIPKHLVLQYTTCTK